MTGWGDDLADWWVEEVATDRAYDIEVLPLALDLLDPTPGTTQLDIGCGEGRFMRSIAARGAEPIGCDLSDDLLTRAAEHGRVVRCELPSLEWAEDASVDGAAIVLVLEHVAHHDTLLAEAARVVRPGGVLALVVNHPVFTAAGSAPVADPDDDEILWRWGDYFGRGVTTEPAGAGTISFHHRSLADLLTAAAQAGWALERLVEQPAGEWRRSQDPILAAQGDIPRLLGARWTRT